MWLWQDSMVWFSYVWDNVHLKLPWKFHQDLTCFGCFREDLKLVWFGLVWDNVHLKMLWKFHQDLICFVWFREDLELVWFCLKKYPSEVWRFCKRSDLFWLFLRRFRVGLLCYGLDWYGLDWYCFIWFDFCESFIKIQLGLAVLEKIIVY